ncbi:glucose-6-phosphate dehydrogenase assembly protein OpcA [Isoptericola sp. CG 20/1183]|uniref:Glucose-6-phosphate dehydrogenase assembly protein OpcA n=1 Tax=Isoptericola halotolerans TaxID=300560 RepID=A0ABX5ED15_9MICO|nr:MULTISPECIES: glucose-6-phosphate dehydrogenase assembly protein OpcA [Isoptericola]MCK0115757.1 glucose-6-phosphate dehydrogenase assembly protein OpcA [Isoptericola sp. S6320L]PRZ03485.1 glucose-6-phosphate dehydrogenase assembly protein OpcA [Isoptericola sp. CG 20/1183]PRZ03772.1 glucose-6-phosphate dehydrogenase assembly protein OpcA [Isoptericola halotolerans]
MIIDMPDTTTNAVSKRLDHLRDEGGAVALGRVLTLVVVAVEDDIEAAVAAANEASHEHPCRVIVVAPLASRGTAGRLDAQIRVGGDAGASEVVVLRCAEPLRDHPDTLVMPLLLPDAPIVVWWPTGGPADPVADPLGAMAQRRITDTTTASDPVGMLGRLAASFTEGDTDLAWARVTLWRGLIAAAIDQPPYEPVTAVRVEGQTQHTSLDLLAAWLGLKLKCPATVERTEGSDAITRVTLERRSGPIVLDRPDGRVVTISQPGKPERRMSLPIRSLSEALIEELRRLDPDEIYGQVLAKGLARVETVEAVA